MIFACHLNKCLCKGRYCAKEGIHPTGTHEALAAVPEEALDAFEILAADASAASDEILSICAVQVRRYLEPCSASIKYAPGEYGAEEHYGRKNAM